MTNSLKHTLGGCPGETVGCLPKRVFTGAPAHICGVFGVWRANPVRGMHPGHTLYRPGEPGPALKKPPGCADNPPNISPQ
ncbi:hypothetical protein ACN38_g6663 [Penicillium nordicum]|uniref:Uncharacterized protein n=1 Tax=Penicillium nordicum TaxID=229535 RepID=A0A0N0RYN5_9EURO|nr:hypothetical protein ACN38_g6663 [Penicillium nordicum]